MKNKKIVLNNLSLWHPKGKYYKTGKFHCRNVFVVPVDYEIKKLKMTTLKFKNGEILEHMRMRECMYVRTATAVTV